MYKEKVMGMKICSRCYLYNSLSSTKGWCSLKDTYRSADELCCVVDSMMMLSVVRERKFICRFLNQVGLHDAAMTVENGLHYQCEKTEKENEDRSKTD
ncbi:MAG: hypothetical protein ACTSW7_03750 [Candidatus Thorarchaeota archaeon]